MAYKCYNCPLRRHFPAYFKQKRGGGDQKMVLTLDGFAFFFRLNQRFLSRKESAGNFKMRALWAYLSGVAEAICYIFA